MFFKIPFSTAEQIIRSSTEKESSRFYEILCPITRQLTFSTLVRGKILRWISRMKTADIWCFCFLLHGVLYHRLLFHQSNQLHQWQLKNEATCTLVSFAAARAGVTQRSPWLGPERLRRRLPARRWGTKKINSLNNVFEYPRWPAFCFEWEHINQLAYRFRICSGRVGKILRHAGGCSFQTNRVNGPASKEFMKFRSSETCFSVQSNDCRLFGI